MVCVEWIDLNWGTKFSDPRVREALALASNRAALTSFAGRGTPAYQWVLPNNPLFDKTLGNVYSYNLTKARQLLAQAGYPNGLSFVLACS